MSDIPSAPKYVSMKEMGLELELNPEKQLKNLVGASKQTLNVTVRELSLMKDETKRAVKDIEDFRHFCTIYHFAIGMLASFSGALILSMVHYTFGLFVPELAKAFPDWTRTNVNGAFGLGQVISNLSAPMWGKLIDSHGCRIVVTTSVLLGGLGFVLLSAVQNLPMLYAAYAAMGLGYTAASQLGPAKLISAWFPKSKRGRILGLAMANNSLEGLIMVQVGAAILVSNDFRVLAGVYAILLIVTGVLYGLIVRNQPKQQVAPNNSTSSPSSSQLQALSPPIQPSAAVGASDPHPAIAPKNETGKNGDAATETQSLDAIAPSTPNESHHSGGARGVSTPTSSSAALPNHHQTSTEEADVSLGEALKTTIFYTTCMGVVCCYFTYSGVLAQFLPAMVAEGFGSDEAAQVVSLIGGLGIPGKIIAGRISELYTARKTLIFALCMQILALVIFIGAPDDASDIGPYWASSAIFGFSFGMLGACLPLVIIETFGATHFGKIFGFVNLMYIVPSCAAPYMAGKSFDMTDTYKIHFMGTVAIFAFGVFLLSLGLCHKARKVDSHGGGGHDQEEETSSPSNNNRQTGIGEDV